MQYGQSRRIRRWRLAAVALVGLGIAATSLGAEERKERKLGTVGPPPRKSPQRQTAAEGMPPLPLPAVPMRRSEPKAEPAAPLFVGQLAYGKTQDYLPNPGAVDNLLRHVRRQMDAWYGHQVITLGEIVALNKAGKPCQIPMLYLTGYETFALDDEEREALREYLLDGGTLVADATLGSPAFARSFQEEMVRMFPKRKLEVMQLDHPVLRGFYKYENVSYFTIEKGSGTKSQSPPQLMGLNIAARTAVIFSPFDLGCGWDDFDAPPASVRAKDAPRSMAMARADAVRTGINIVAYTAAQRRFGKAQAQTRQILGEQPQKRAGVPIALLKHQGDWNPDPNSVQQLLRLAAEKTSVPVQYEVRAVDAELAQLVDTPVLVMTGMDEPRLTDQEVLALRRHLQAGGFLFINNTSGFAMFDREARALIARIFPDQKLESVPGEHALLHGLFDIKEMRDAGTLKARPAELEAVFVDGRASIVYSKNDTLAMLKGIHDPYANAYDAESARRLALNVLTYAMASR